MSTNDKQDWAAKDQQIGVVQFKPFMGTTFEGEYTLDERSFIMHLFPHASWQTGAGQGRFASALDQVAQSFFEATAPNLQAEYIEFGVPASKAHLAENIPSWCVTGRGIRIWPDSAAMFKAFFEALDTAVQGSR